MSLGQAGAVTSIPGRGVVAALDLELSPPFWGKGRQKIGGEAKEASNGVAVQVKGSSCESRTDPPL